VIEEIACSIFNPYLRSSAIDASHVIINTIRTAQDGDGLIVRLSEVHNARGPVTLTFAEPVAQAEQCNLLEARG
jgi:alpha-mannosidase